jgi:hypothetical protein
VSIVDNRSPDEVWEAIHYVNTTPGLRIEPGYSALLDLFGSQNHSLPVKKLAEKYGMFNAHFGWFCRRVAERLGDEEPRPFALTDASKDHHGTKVLTLKPTVVQALSIKLNT